MHLLKNLVGVAALAVSVAAQSSGLFFNALPIGEVTAGRPFVVKYTSSQPNTPVTILLLEGPLKKLHTVRTITDTSTRGSFTWTPSSEMKPGSDYALQLKQGSQMNYSNQFKIAGGSAAAGNVAMNSTGISLAGLTTVAVPSTRPAIPAHGAASAVPTPVGNGTAGAPNNYAFPSPTSNVTPGYTGGASSIKLSGLLMAGAAMVEVLA